MSSSWKALGRTLEIITIVLLVLAVGYLWVNPDSEDTEAPQVASQAPDARTETVEHPYQPPVPTSRVTGTYQSQVPISAETGTFQQPTESSASNYVSHSYVRTVLYSSCSSQPVMFKFSSTMAESPNDVIEEAAMLLDQALDGHRDELANNQEALFALIDEILSPRFDRRYAAQLVLGKHWRNASDQERERFINAFYNQLMCRYASGILNFDIAKLQVLPFHGDATKKRTTVKTFVHLDDGTQVPVNYGMVRRDSGWLMYDVTITIEGISFSYVRNFRAEMNAEIQARGLNSVIERLEAGTSDGAAK